MSPGHLLDDTEAELGPGLGRRVAGVERALALGLWNPRADQIGWRSSSVVYPFSCAASFA